MQLHNILLPDDIQWIDEWECVPVAQTIKRRLDGGLVIYARNVTAGRAITLEATEDHALDRTILTELQTLTTHAGAAYDLIMPLYQTSFRVVFRHNDPPILDFKPMFDFADPLPTDWMIGKIKLLTI